MLEAELTDARLDRPAPAATVGPLLPAVDLYPQTEPTDRQAVDPKRSASTSP